MTKDMVHWQNDTDTGKQKYFKQSLSKWISQATMNFFKKCDHETNQSVNKVRYNYLATWRNPYILRSNQI
jgi:hypothetical protein